MIGMWLKELSDRGVAQGLERCVCCSGTGEMWVWLKDFRYVGVAQGLKRCGRGSKDWRDVNVAQGLERFGWRVGLGTWKTRGVV